MPKRAETAFARKLRQALRPYPADGHYLVGVSGGRDSVALLHGLVTEGYTGLVVCHLNHGLRGDEGKADAAFVRRLAEGYGLTVETGEADVRTLAGTESLSVETAAREARYRFFAEVAGDHQCQTLFLAHHADDQAETFLFNLLRGAGPAGLAAMRTKTIRRTGAVELEIVRPLLGVWRKEIDIYLKARDGDWRDDATNANPAFGTRNRLRLEALPMLSAVMGRDVKPALWRAAELLGEEQEEQQAARSNLEDDALPERLPVRTLRAQPLAERRRTVHRWLRARGVPDVGYREVAAVLSLVEGEAQMPAKVNLPGGKHARRRTGVVFLDGEA